jgi:hypothetical protein
MYEELKNDKFISTYAPPNSSELVAPEDGCVSSLSASLQIGMAWRRVLRASADVLGASIGAQGFMCFARSLSWKWRHVSFLARWRGAMMPRVLCTLLSDSFGVGRE